VSQHSSISLTHLNVGKAEKLPDGKPTKSGINKCSTGDVVAVGELGLAGDAICNLKHHGGLDQAVYFYSLVDYTWWEQQLGRDCPPGLFGENCTVDEPASGEICIGDRFTSGDVILETTSPRIPCNTLNRRMNDPKFSPAFRTAERPGWYCRVLGTGTLQAGAVFTHIPFTGERITMVEAMRDYYLRTRVPRDQAARYLTTPAHQKTHTLMQQILTD